MSEATDTVGVSSEAKECSHKPEYRVNRTQDIDGIKHCVCGACGSGLWIVDGNLLVTVKKAKVIDFTYRCDGCGAVFEYPSGAFGHGCE